MHHEMGEKVYFFPNRIERLAALGEVCPGERQVAWGAIYFKCMCVCVWGGNGRANVQKFKDAILPSTEVKANCQLLIEQPNR